jgi:hypothetical protein
LSQFLEWRRNREDSVFEFDFGYDDDSIRPLSRLNNILGF